MADVVCQEPAAAVVLPRGVQSLGTFSLAPPSTTSMSSLTSTVPAVSSHLPAARPRSTSGRKRLVSKRQECFEKKKKKKQAAGSLCTNSSRTEGILCPVIHAELSGPSGSSRVRQPPTFSWVLVLSLLAQEPAAIQDSFVSQSTGTSFGICWSAGRLVFE